MRRDKLHLTGPLVVAVAAAVLMGLLIRHSVCLAETPNWSGVDESVVEKVAKEHGREARSPLINTDQGDLLLFVFLLAGAVGGFVAGYYWRTLLDQRSKPLQEERKDLS
jgi:cobalt/nickel transport system permease protein